MSRTTTAIYIVIALIIVWRLFVRLRPAPKAAAKTRAPIIRNQHYRLLRSLTVASMKMYFRNRSALFFTVFFPIVLVSVFGLLSNGNGNGSIKLTLTNYSSTQLSKSYVEAIKKVPAFSVDQTNEGDARDQLSKGKVDLEVVIPKDFGAVSAGHLAPTAIQTYYNQARPGNGQSASLILGQIASGFNNSVTHTPTVIGLKSTGVQTNNLGYIDFILPGILAMTIMQLGIFSVAFGFISFKTSGALRRIQATPINAANFLVAQSITRYIVGILQIALLGGLGVVFFHLHLLGSVFNLFVITTLGIAVFLAMGFAVAGQAKDENQAAPLAQLLQLPQLFLSGIFFPRDAFPHWLKVVTDYFPLTYLSDGMRSIFNEGASLWTLRGDLLGLVVWLVIAYFIADRVFSWE
jgi:ABC-2 type transport system permease protein